MIPFQVWKALSAHPLALRFYYVCQPPLQAGNTLQQVPALLRTAKNYSSLLNSDNDGEDLKAETYQHMDTGETWLHMLALLNILSALIYSS